MAILDRGGHVEHLLQARDANHGRHLLGEDLSVGVPTKLKLLVDRLHAVEVSGNHDNLASQHGGDDGGQEAAAKLFLSLLFGPFWLTEAAMVHIPLSHERVSMADILRLVDICM